MLKHRSRFPSYPGISGHDLYGSLSLLLGICGRDAAKLLKNLVYEVSRQTGSHMRLTTLEYGENHVTIPRHKTLRAGTLSAILSDVAEHFSMSRDDLMKQLME